MTTSHDSEDTVAVIGYGAQGRAISLNLRDSGYPVVLGLRPRSKSRRAAARDGVTSILTIPQAVKRAGVVCFAFPDHLHRRVFRRTIAAHLRGGATLWFLAGMSIHFGLVRPPEKADVILIAPHAPGVAVRQNFLDKRGFSAFYAVKQDNSGRGKRTVISLARAIGVARRSLVATTFEQEAIGDLFGEQAILCGGLAALVKNGFDTLTDAGLPPEHAYLEVVYQLDLIIELIKQYGVEGMLRRISVAARLGSVTSGPRVIDSSVRKRMEQVLNEIRSGQFARRLNRLSAGDISRLNRQIRRLSSPALERAARKYAR